ncbi:hypothetical protein PSTT_09391 [Puccinia striiformis]|uniref:Uncharacterized protein n=1 Tax=Puccinia striiformis TaxID=27350 RepID=A0A2S4V8H2_9BASI|nr:hypothetical protein PSTT_09391 [Puccinia striiformis]
MQGLSNNPSPAASAAPIGPDGQPKPIVLLHVREASASDAQGSPTEFEKRSMEEGRTPELVTSALPGTSFGSKRLHKNPNLNISIPPLATVKSTLGLSPSGITQDPMTPVYQMVHTPTTAPGAPGPGDPAEIRRLEESWAANMVDYDQISPAFPNFRPPTFNEFPIKQNYDSRHNHPSAYSVDHPDSKNNDDSLALREMFALTASAKTPTFPPPSSPWISER